MTDQVQKQLGKTLWDIADQLRGAMNADDFRDYMLSFLFLRYLSILRAAREELGAIPDLKRTAAVPPFRGIEPPRCVGVRDADAT